MSEPGPPDEPGAADEPDAPLTPPALIAWSSTNSLPPPPPPPPAASPPALGAPPPSAPASGSSPVRTVRAPRKRWIVVLVAVLGTTVLLAGAGTALFFNNTYPPLRAAYDFVDDVNDGDPRGAFEQLCNGHPLRNRDGFESFYIAIQDANSIGVDIFSVDRDGDTANVDVTVDETSGSNFHIPLQLIHEDDKWRVCGFGGSSR